MKPFLGMETVLENADNSVISDHRAVPYQPISLDQPVILSVNESDSPASQESESDNEPPRQIPRLEISEVTEASEQSEEQPNTTETVSHAINNSYA